MWILWEEIFFSKTKHPRPMHLPNLHTSSQCLIVFWSMKRETTQTGHTLSLTPEYTRQSFNISPHDHHHQWPDTHYISLQILNGGQDSLRTLISMIWWWWSHCWWWWWTVRLLLLDSQFQSISLSLSLSLFLSLSLSLPLFLSDFHSGISACVHLLWPNNDPSWWTFTFDLWSNAQPHADAARFFWRHENRVSNGAFHSLSLCASLSCAPTN